MKKLVTIPILFAVSLLFTESISASPQTNFPRNRASVRPYTGRLLALLKARRGELEITGEQLNKIKDLIETMKDKTLETRNEVTKIQLELRRQLRNRESRDYEKIKSLISQTSNLRSNLLINRMILRDDINNILTSNQLTALKDIFRKTFLRRRLLNRRDQLQRNPDLRKPIRR